VNESAQFGLRVPDVGGAAEEVRKLVLVLEPQVEEADAFEQLCVDRLVLVARVAVLADYRVRVHLTVRVVRTGEHQVLHTYTLVQITHPIRCGCVALRGMV